jgi:hypothetical protein
MFTKCSNLPCTNCIQGEVTRITNIKLSNEIVYLNISSTINYDYIKYSLNRLLEERKWVAIAILDHSENTYYKNYMIT